MAMRFYISSEEAAFFNNNKMGYADSIPTTGSYKVGDFIISSTQLDGIFGWVCTEEGTPGKWEVIGSGAGGGKLVSINASKVVDTAVNQISLAELGLVVSSKDKLMIHFNSMFLMEGVDYQISADGSMITKLGEGNWNESNIEGCLFTFELLKNVENIDNNEVKLNSKLLCEKNNVTVNEAVSEVNIGISGFDKDNDVLTVYKNATYLMEGVDYQISADGSKIVSLNGIWNENVDADYIFTFVVFKEVATINPDAVVNTEHLVDGSVTMDKLSNDIKQAMSEEVTASRGSYDWLPDRLDNFDSQLEHIEKLGVKKGELTVNVKDYGAVGDGIADDTDAIKSALNDGTIITFPRGIYRITDTIYINKSFVMIGSDWCGDTNLNEATTTIFLDNITPRKYAFVCNFPNNKIKGLTFKGKGYDINSDRREWSNCFKFNKGTVYGDTDVEIENCHFYKFCTSIEFEGRGLHCSNNQFVESWKPIILKHFNNDESINTPLYDWQTNIRGFRKFHFVNNQIHSCQGWFVSCMSTSNNNYEKYIHQVVVSGNRFDGTGGVWEGFIGGGIVTGNTIGKSDSTVYGDVRIPIFSLLGCKQMTFVGNTIYSELDYSSINGRKTQIDDVFVFGQNIGDFQDIVITGNTIRNVGRRIVKASQASIYRFIFSNNNINGVLLIENSQTVSAFEFDEGANYIKIKDNIIFNTNEVKHDKLINFTQRGVQNHDLKDNIFSPNEFVTSNNAYAWNKNSNVLYSSYTGNGSSSQSFTVNQNIDYIIISDSVNYKSFVKRAGSSLGDNVCTISDNSYTIQNTSDFNNNGTTYSIIIVCC